MRMSLTASTFTVDIFTTSEWNNLLLGKLLPAKLPDGK
jgi:hypothetical protein